MSIRDSDKGSSVELKEEMALEHIDDDLLRKIHAKLPKLP